MCSSPGRSSNWSDGEGTVHAVQGEIPALRAALVADARVTDVALTPVARPGRSVGLYAFVEGDLSAKEARALVPPGRLAFVQVVPALPRAEGQIRSDILELVAANRLDELEIILARDAALRAIVAPIRDARLNFSDRVLRGREMG